LPSSVLAYAAIGAGGAGVKAAPGSWCAARTGDVASPHAAASANAPPAIGPASAEKPLVEKLHDGNKIASPKAWSRRNLRCRWWKTAARVRWAKPPRD